MLRAIIVIAALGSLSACGNHYIPLPTVQDRDPVFQLNADRWTATVNDLTAPPGDGSPRQLPPVLPVGRGEARRYE